MTLIRTQNGRLFALLTFSVTLVILRVLYTSEITFIFMVWNLFLAVIPFVISSYLSRSKQLRLWKALPAMLVWLLFLPNAPYMTTDLFHLRLISHSHIWYDTLLILSFAISGLLLFLLSIRQMNEVVKRLFPVVYSRILIPVLFLLSAFGIYLGRYLRFNSWDVIREPSDLLWQIADLMLHPFDHPRTWAMTVFYAIFLFLLYQFIQPVRKVRGEIN